MPNIVQLVPVVKVSNDCKSILFADKTDWYDPYISPNGYDDTGINSTDPDDVDTNNAFIDITLIDGSTKKVVKLPPTNFDKTQIGKAGFCTYSITAGSLGLNAYADGIYKITYRFKLLSTGKTLQTTVYLMSTCSVDCCLDAKLTQLGCCHDCSDQDNSRKIYNLYRAFLMQDKAAYQLSCNDISGAKKTIECLQEYCNQTPCTNCN